MSAEENATLETDAIKLELPNREKQKAEKEKSEGQQSVEKKEIKGREAKNEERENLIKKLNKEKELEKQTLKDEKIKNDTTDRVIEEVKTEHIKSVLWRSFLGIFIKKYKIEAEKIKLAKKIFAEYNKKDKTEQDNKNIWNKIQEYTKKSTEITKKAPKSEILEQPNQTKQVKNNIEKTTQNQDKEKAKEKNDEVKTR